MGIQGFFNYFMSESENQKPNKKFIVEEIIDNTVSRLYIDFVNIVHDVLNENKDIDNGSDEADVLIKNKVLERLGTIFDHYPKAKKFVYFECIPTVAKIKEQYSRRIYRKIQTDVENDLKFRCKIPQQSRFDHHKFAIDSDFIKMLAEAIEEHFTDQDIEVYKFANDEVGEAEHRIINHIKNTKFKNDDTFVMYSPDADVFLLSAIVTNLMDSNSKRITINTMRRSDDSSNRLFYKIDTHKYIDYLVQKINQPKKIKNQLINDVTYIFNLLGDDFIPIFDIFKTSNAKDIFPTIFKALAKLDDTEYILEYSEKSNRYTINKLSLVKIFDYLSSAPKPNQRKTFEYKYNMQYPEKDDDLPLTYSKIVYSVLSDAFQKGYYFYEKEKKYRPNKNNFGITDDNFDKDFATEGHFLQYEEDYNRNQYVITAKKSAYKTINLVGLDNGTNDKNENNNSGTAQRLIKHKYLRKQKRIDIDSGADSDNNNIIKNYFEGYEFILDMYYNECGTVRNNFWYYKHNSSPKIENIVKWLSENDLPTYVNNDDVKVSYFTNEQYKKYLFSLIDDNYNKLIQSGKQSIEYDDLVKISKKKNSNVIFDCFEKKYLNKCEIKGEIIPSPFDFVADSKNTRKNRQMGGFVDEIFMAKYFKYKNKCDELLKKVEKS